MGYKDGSGLIKKKDKCEGPDSNRRTPTRIGPEPIAFDLARQPSLLCSYLLDVIGYKYVHFRSKTDDERQ